MSLFMLSIELLTNNDRSIIECVDIYAYSLSDALRRYEVNLIPYNSTIISVKERFKQ